MAAFETILGQNCWNVCRNTDVEVTLLSFLSKTVMIMAMMCAF